MQPIKQAVNLGCQITKFNIDLAQYIVAQVGSKVGLCEVSEYKSVCEQDQIDLSDDQQSQDIKTLEKHSHPTHLKVHFLKQFSKYWIIHNVGQEITISYEEFQKIISKYAKFYNEKSDKLLKDFYDSAHTIWNDIIKKQDRTPTTKDIKHAILKIVAHTLHKDVDQDHEHNFGDQLYNIFKQFIEQDLKIKEKPIIKQIRQTFDHNDHVKAVKEYTKFFKDFIQEFFPHKEYDLSHQKFLSIKNTKKFINKAICRSIMLSLNNIEFIIDLAFLFENSVKENITSKLNIKKNIKDIDLDVLVNGSKSDLTISENEDSSSQEQLVTPGQDAGLKKVIKILEKNLDLTEKQRRVLLQEETIKNKLQIIALKLFLIGKKCYSYSQRVTLKKTYNFMNRDNISVLLFETKNCVVGLTYLYISKLKNQYRIGIQYGEQKCIYYSEQLQKLPVIVKDHFQEVQKARKENGLLGILFYEKSLLALKKKKQMQQQIEQNQEKQQEEQKEQEQEIQYQEEEITMTPASTQEQQEQEQKVEEQIQENCVKKEQEQEEEVQEVVVSEGKVEERQNEEEEHLKETGNCNESSEQIESQQQVEQTIEKEIEQNQEQEQVESPVVEKQLEQEQPQENNVAVEQETQQQQESEGKEEESQQESVQEIDGKQQEQEQEQEETNEKQVEQVIENNVQNGNENNRQQYKKKGKKGYNGRNKKTNSNV